MHPTVCNMCPITEFFLVRIFPHSYWIRFWSVFSHIRIEYGEIRSISSNSVRMRDQNNSEYGLFLRSVTGLWDYSNKMELWKMCRLHMSIIRNISEAYFEPSRTSKIDLFLWKSCFSKKLYLKCTTWFWIRLSIPNKILSGFMIGCR